MINNDKKKVFISIVIPCFNEEKNIPLVLARFDKIIGSKKIEVILVDNGSTDDSAQVLSKLLPKYSFAKLVKVKINQGYGFGILSGLRAAKGDYIGWTHADMQTDPKDVIRAMEIIEKSNSGSIFIKGKRLGRPFFDSLFTAGMAGLESLFFGTGLWEINAQPTLFPRDFFRRWKNPPHDFSIDLYAYVLAKRFELKIIRFPVRFPKRIYGVSSWNSGLRVKLKLIKRTLGYSWKLRKEMANGKSLIPEFIAHRVNTIAELKKIPDHYGVELDLRDRDDGKLILQHEPFISGEDFESYLKHYHHGTMILNIKSERIEPRVIELLKKYNIDKYFFLDSSFPMIYTLSQQGERNIAVRFSEFESKESILAVEKRVKWIWIDCFTTLPIDQELFQIFKNAGMKLCLVSPELQGRTEDVENYKKYLEDNDITFDAICTKSYNVERWL